MEMAKSLMNFWFQIEMGNHFRPYRALKLVYISDGWLGGHLPEVSRGRVV